MRWVGCCLLGLGKGGIGCAQVGGLMVGWVFRSAGFTIILLQNCNLEAFSSTLSTLFPLLID